MEREDVKTGMANGFVRLKHSMGEREQGLESQGL